MRTPVLRRLICLLALSSLCGCQEVKFYEKQRLSTALMRFDASPTEVHFFAKNTYSREGSVGGIGASAGGGCGCY